jgi:hypothetical protein
VQRRTAASEACTTCPHYRGGDITRSDCALSDRPVPLSVGVCPDGRFDNSKVDETAPIAAAIESSPRDRWPLWARLIARRKIAADVGVGDTFKRLADTGGIGSAYEKLWKKLGTTCGCSDRRKRWNRMFRYSGGQAN